MAAFHAWLNRSHNHPPPYLIVAADNEWIVVARRLSDLPAGVLRLQDQRSRRGTYRSTCHARGIIDFKCVTRSNFSARPAVVAKIELRALLQLRPMDVHCPVRHSA